jgi:hypothetical protein
VRRAGTFSVLALLLGCESLAGPTYAGDPALRIAGTIIGPGVDQVGDIAAILWNANDAPRVPTGPTTAVPLRPMFPANLTLDILSAPPASAFFQFEDGAVRIAEGYFHLARVGAAPPFGSDDLVGAALDTVVVYVEGTMADGSLAADYLGGRLEPGYHLLGWRATATMTAAQGYLSQRCAETGEGSVPDCAKDRLYRLIETSSDLDTLVVFTRHVGP